MKIIKLINALLQAAIKLVIAILKSFLNFNKQV